jgi:serine phosphatase RsbU (regulator of sigma subunit)
LLVLYTDGVIEAMSSTREQFGVDRLASMIDAQRGQPVAAIRDTILSAVGQWSSDQRDDRTLVVMRYQGNG